jgi:hypothetical protein
MPSDTMPPIPDRLRYALSRWDDGGRRGQQPMWWRRRTWQTTLPEHQDLLASLPDNIGRAVAAERGAIAIDGQAEAVEAFVAAMVWGYGPIGYGAFRTARVLAENPQAPEILLEAAQRVRRDGGASAFAWLKEHRLRYLGVAFATKYLYFCNGPESAPEPALILDRLVQRWMRQHAACPLRLGWHVGDYTRYLHLAGAWADELEIRSDEVEYLMFSDALSEEPGRRGAAAARPETEPDEGETAAVMEAVDDAAAAFAALADVSTADTEDFERGVRQLRRILLARNT